MKNTWTQVNTIEEANNHKLYLKMPTIQYVRKDQISIPMKSEM